ncbi:MAG: hypothetical protein KKB25_01520 [Nanoarchaeota archaeon]|nr:hypothetical protein [Nanoarchaeota archaeon]
MEIKRLTAKKAGISEITKGKFFKKPGFESNYVLTHLGRRLSRVRVLGLVVDKFMNSDGSYSAITIDDSSDTIRCKFFGGLKIFDGVEAGSVVDAVGKVREYNGEIYIAPEIVTKITDPNFETMRILELALITRQQKERIAKIKELKLKTSDTKEIKESAKYLMSEEDAEAIIEAEGIINENLSAADGKTEQPKDAKETVIKIVNESGKDGVDYQMILAKSGLPESAVDMAVQSLLESGILFEPRPGKLKSL